MKSASISTTCAKQIHTGRLWKYSIAEARNGVLIYVACSSKVFAIVGDKGINDAVPADFWNEVSDTLHSYFTEGKFAEGLAEAVRMAGARLKRFFPYRKDDVNELPDEISFKK